MSNVNQHNFKEIQVVPNYEMFVDHILSKTQRKTPTVIHKQYAIVRIRSFYMRKVKFTQQNFDERLSKIINDFPRINDVHPFYSDIFNVLFDADHYKVALSHISRVRSIISDVAKEYLRMLKYADSLYRCKSLKKIALGRMVSAVKNVKESLIYLEDVRQHLARFPNIDPSMRTLILCGFPNVGKSSFINRVSRAEVEVQPYAFTTKSLFVGHFDYQYLRWQIIDTPGVLDHPLDDMNTIEMTSITALANLTATVCFMMDVSEQCGYSVEQQISLFVSLKPIFQANPIVVGLNKVDLFASLDKIGAEKKTLIESTFQGVDVVALSTLSGEGVAEMKKTACDILLDRRVESKIRNDKKFNKIQNRINVSIPAVRNRRMEVYVPPEVNSIENTLSDERSKPRPEIVNGRNVYDYVDENIEEKIGELLKVEAKREMSNFYKNKLETIDQKDLEKVQLYDRIQLKKKEIMAKHAMGKTGRVSMDKVLKNKLKKRDNFKKHKMLGSAGEDRTNLADLEGCVELTTKSRDKNTEKYENKLVKSGMTGERLIKAEKQLLMHRKKTARLARKGDADRHIPDLMPKHLFSGKRKAGKTSRR